MITVVTIAYNNLAGLGATAASVESQRCEFAWIVVDGGSTDGTLDFLKQNERISTFVSAPDRGIYDAMRKGLELCETPYVLFLNAGDEFHSAHALGATLAEVSNHDVYFFDTLIRSDRRSWVRKARPLASASYSVPAVQQSTIYRVAELRALDWPTAYRICGDYYIAAQLLARGSTSVSRNLTLSTFHIGGVSTESFVLLCKEALDIQRRCLSIPAWRLGVDFVRRIAAGLLVFSVHRLRFIR